MHPSDFDAFSALLTGLSEFYDTPELTASYKAIYFKTLAELSLPEVEAGFMAHMRNPDRRSDFMPRPGAIIAGVKGLIEDDGRPATEEAWAKAVRSADESETVVWTAEMAQAWAEVAPLYAKGDKIGARMAFKDVYARLVDEARRARRPVAWSAALGFDLERRALALAASAHLLEPHPDMPRVEGPSRVLIAGPGQSADPIGALAGAAPEDARQRLLALRARLTGVADVESPDAAARRRTETLRQHAAALVAERMAVGEINHPQPDALPASTQSIVRNHP